MFKTRLISGILLVIAALLTIISGELCAVCDIALRFSARNAGTL